MRANPTTATADPYSPVQWEENTATLDAGQSEDSPDAQISDLSQSRIMSSSLTSSKRFSATELSEDIPEIPLDEDTSVIPDFSLSSLGEISTETLRKLIDGLPKTKMFNPLKLVANQLYGNVECLPPKVQRVSLESRLSQLHADCPLLKERAKDHCERIKEFFTAMTPFTDNSEGIKSDFRKLEAEHAEVGKWLKKELEPLRARVRRGDGIQLTADQRDFNAYQLRSSLPKEVIEANRKASDAKYAQRKALLCKIEKEWDETSLCLQEIKDTLDISDNFQHMLDNLKELKNESLSLANKAKALRELSLKTPYLTKQVVEKLDITQSFLELKAQQPSQKDLKDIINDKSELQRELSSFQFKKKLMLKNINQALLESKIFIEGESDVKRFTSFLDFMAFPDSAEIVEAKTHIFESSNNQMLNMSKQLVNVWNDIGLNYLQAQEEWQLAERIQDVYPQLGHIRENADNICASTRYMRKNQIVYSTALSEFAKYATSFNNLVNCILTKNTCSFSRTDRTYNNLGFKVLYEDIVKKITSSINFFKEHATSVFKEYEFIAYQADTDKRIHGLLEKLCQSLASAQEIILSDMQHQYEHLKNDSFEKLTFELDRTYYAHDYIEKNKAKFFDAEGHPLKDIRDAYGTETSATGYKRLGYVHFKSPLS